MSSEFNQLQDAYNSGGLDQALQVAASTTRQQQQYHELFEVLKMQHRQRLGLPLLPLSDEGELPEQMQRQLETGLLQACSEVGFLLLEADRIQDSWTFLRHLNQREEILQRLSAVPVTPENQEALVGILLHEGLDVARGFELVLQHYGTCNAITTMQNALYGRSKSDRQAAGRLLVRHVHAELLENVRAHIQREQPETNAAEISDLATAMDGRDFLFADGSYHLDTSHLSSTVSVAAELTDDESLQLALELAAYGQRLDAALQYASDPPFEETFTAYAKFYQVQLGQDVEAGLQYFRERAEATDAHHQGTYVIEVYVDLLARIGRPADAMELMLQLIPAGMQTTGRAPTLYDLSQQSGDFGRYREVCQQRGDVLGYLLSLNV